jgi:hypothetical protein
MITAFYTLVQTDPGLCAVTEPGRPGKVKSYTKPQFARSARTQRFHDGDNSDYNILETIVWEDGRVTTVWID